MALATTIVGDGILISTEVDPRVWFIYGVLATVKYTETTTVEVRQWVSLTQSAAKTAAETATQPAAPTPPILSATASYVAAESVRVVGSYTLTKTTTTIELESEII